MTNFEPLKLRIWNDARAEKWDIFNEDCEALMNKAVGDWWRIGWNIAPKDINDVYQMLDALAGDCHEAWLKAITEGDAPPEDISPGEGFALVKKVIQEAVEGKSNDGEGKLTNDSEGA